ncbi:MAG TPA: spermidine/putrescine ABC transporter substrate-binding protein [Gaiellales bacterium]|jgi:spermidine/putrescine transport system substrate-binding protein
MHPKDRRSGATRRDFLLRSGGAAFALSGAGSLLAACSNSTTANNSVATGANGQKLGPLGLPLARPNGPVTIPRYEQPIASGMQPETGGDFVIFNYPDYIDPALLKAFGKKYGVTCKVTPFDDINSGITKLASGTVKPDVMEMTPDNIARVVAAKLIKPLNLDYIPNLQKNVWPSLVDPFYDKGSRYSVPYTCYTTGILYRTDFVKEDIPTLTPNPWDIFWRAQKYRGKTALLSEVRETIAMALLHRGDKDINTEDPAKIDQAVKDLQQLYGICNVKVGDLQYSAVAERKAYLNQAWSGDAIAGYLFYADKESKQALRFWNPGRGNGPIQNDMFSICSSTKKPVLSHLFLNFILDNTQARNNFLNYNGYQPPLTEIDPGQMVQDGILPESLQNTVLTADDLGPTSLQEMTLTTQGQALWQNAYSQFLSGA